MTLVLIMTFCFAGCETQHKIKFYVGDELVKEYRLDSNRIVPNFDPHVDGFPLISWQESPTSQPYDFSKGADKTVELHGKFNDALNGTETFTPSKFTAVEVDQNNAKFENFGKVLSVSKSDKGIYVVAEGYFGYHLDENPSMTVGVTISLDGTIKAVSVISASHQSEGYAEMITQSYLNSVYPETPANTTNEVEPATGATSTSKAVRYAVWTASNYASKAFNIVSDTSSKDNEVLNKAFAAEYTKLNSTYKLDSAIGQVLYAANGVSASGEKLLGVVIKAAQTINRAGSDETGAEWESTLPNAATVAIVFSKDTNKIVGINVVSDGAKSPEYFTVPQKNLDAYKSVAVTSEDAFDNFKGGIVLNVNDIDIGSDVPPITGTSILYTGATTDGTFTSQIVRNAFKGAARVFVNNK
ncbi:MAG: FMN-binding protein [Clostridia bacterium]